MTQHDLARLKAKLRAVMSRTVANGCTEPEEMAAARMVATYVGAIDRLTGEGAEPKSNWAHDERESPDYKALLEKNTLESLLTAAVRELALDHVNAIAPPHRKNAGLPVERVRAMEVLMPHLSMALCAGGSRLSHEILARTIEELIYQGMLPEYLAIPRGE